MTQIKCYCGHTTYCDCGPLDEQAKAEGVLVPKPRQTGAAGFIVDEYLRIAKEYYGNEEDDEISNTIP
jgi:hypothetical protein